MQALLAAKCAVVPVQLLVDNMAIVIRLRRGLDGVFGMGTYAFWSMTATCVSAGVQVMWIPSHDKLPDLWIGVFRPLIFAK